MTKIFHTRKNREVEVREIEIKTFKDYDKEGNSELKQYVQFIIIGKTREHVDYLPLSDFKESNPGFPFK